MKLLSCFGKQKATQKADKSLGPAPTMQNQVSSTNFLGQMQSM